MSQSKAEHIDSLKEIGFSNEEIATSMAEFDKEEL